MSTGLPSLREKQKQQTRLAIIRKAFELFGKQGYAAVSVELICEAVGISRATFFNYFPQKDLILREIARSRVEKLKSIVARFAAGGNKVSFPDIVSLFLEIAEENARITAGSRRLILELWFRQIAHGPMMESREEALTALVGVIERIPRRKQATPRLIAETLFAIYMATMLEWLIREQEPAVWLSQTMRERLEVAVKGMA